MNKIAIIGNSPIMLILANFLQKKKKQHVTIIKDKKNIGGAWSYFKFRNKLAAHQQSKSQFLSHNLFDCKRNYHKPF